MARVANTLTQRDKVLHAQQRRVLAQGFTDSALRTCEDVIYEHCLNLCQRIQELEIQAGEWSVPQDMAKWCKSSHARFNKDLCILTLRTLVGSYCAFDTMLDIIYSTKSDMVNKADNRPLLDAIAISNIRVGTMIPLHRYKGSYLDFILFRSAIKARYEFIGFIRKLLDEKANETKSPTQRKSIYDILMSSRDGEGLTPIEIAAESTNLIVAGFDTTATSISACLFYLSRYPTIYEKVTTEIRSQFSSIEDIRSKTKVNTCSYLRACLTESMRMAPAISASPFREVESGGVIVDGQALPAGCDVGTGIYAIQHNDRYYADPFLFRPERWIVGSQEEGLSCKEDVDAAQNAFMAFGKGSRICIGRPLAFQESMTFMAMMLYLFDFRVADGQAGKLGGGVLGAEFGRHRPDEYQLFDHVTAVHEGPMLQFRKRGDIDGI